MRFTQHKNTIDWKNSAKMLNAVNEYILFLILFFFLHCVSVFLFYFSWLLANNHTKIKYCGYYQKVNCVQYTRMMLCYFQLSYCCSHQNHSLLLNISLFCLCYLRVLFVFQFNFRPVEIHFLVENPMIRLLYAKALKTLS